MAREVRGGLEGRAAAASPLIDPLVALAEELAHARDITEVGRALFGAARRMTPADSTFVALYAPDELEALLTRGIQLGQGYLLGRPAAVEAWPAPRGA